MSAPRHGGPLARIMLSCGLAGLGAGLLAGLLRLLGVPVDVAFVALLAVAVTGVVGLARRLRLAEQVSTSREELDQAPVRTRNPDRAVRLLERQLWAVQPQHRMGCAQLQQRIVRLARERAGSRLDPAPPPATPSLDRYLITEPPPAVSRRELRTLLKELSTL